MSTPESNLVWPEQTATSTNRAGRAAGWAAVAMFVVWIGFAALAFVWNLEQRSLFHRAQHHPFSVTLDDVHHTEARADFLNHTFLVLGVITAAIFITWLYLEYRQLHQSKKRARFAAGWAIGAWFVPFLNLVRPFQVVEDVWKATGGRRSGSRSLVACWWGACIVSAFVGRAASGSDDDAKTLHEALNMNALYIARAVSLLVAAVLALLLVRGVLHNPVTDPASGVEIDS